MRLLSRTSLLVIVPLAVLGGACKQTPSEPASSAAPAATEAPPAIAGTASAFTQAIFEIKGMTCASCNVAVKVAAEKVPGVREARASHEEQRAWVTYDPSRTNPSVIASAITNAGYEATALGDARPTGSAAN
jgi:copper chaperone CopZ